ncbi:hypothetical protein DL95DRAFT_419153 [Leptodontidium sp. 2 PMI_412]|nr:hypothetical protein DL95DRAFT_419153 [Leptodontidium sp. 2 PMI_412]
MASLKRNRSDTLAKSPPGSPIRPITKRSRQKTPESSTTSTTLLLPLRPTKHTPTHTPTAFNSSQADESESEEENIVAQVISESESEEETESEEEDDTTVITSPDRLDREDIDESDVEREVDEEVKISKSFSQSIINLEGNWSIPFKKVIDTPTLKPKGPYQSKLASLKIRVLILRKELVVLKRR